MAKTKISEFSATPGNNTDIDGINIAEGCAPSGINDAIRELMSQLKDFQTGAAGDSFNGPIGSVTPGAGAFTTLSASSTLTLSGGTANGVLYLNGSKVATSGSALTFDGTNLGIGTSNNNVFDQVGAARPLVVQKSDTSTTIAGSTASITISNSDTTTNNTAQLNFAAITGANTNQYSSAIISAIFGARTNGQYPTGQLVFSTSTSLNAAPTEKMRIDSSGNVGIGTSSPTRKLQISSSGSTCAIRLDNTVSGRPTILAYDDSQNLTLTNSSDTGYFAFVNGTGAGTERMRIDSSGNVGIGTSSPAAKFQTNSTDGTIAIFRTTSGANNGRLNIDISDSAGTAGFSIGGNSTFPALTFANGGSERMRIDSSGNVRINNTSNATYSAQLNTQFTSSLNCGLYLKVTNTSSSQSMIIFGNTTNDAVGAINTSGSSTSYVTSSDYRLKENIAPMTGALAKVALLKPCTYTWKADGSAGQGFIAHELQAVVPDCVTGEKDAIDEEGKPEYQGVDTSFLVATLTAAIKEQQAIIEQQSQAIASLTTRIAALEAK